MRKKSWVVPCKNGCKEGKCINSDEESNCEEKTKCISIGNIIGEDEFEEHTRICNRETKTWVVHCKNGCLNERCIKEVLNPSNYTGPIDIPDKYIKNKTLAEELMRCNGCQLDNKCYPFGFRKSGEYCSDKEGFTKQLNAESSCENNFECDSNLCINNQCISGSLWQKIVDWFSKLFGGNW